MKNLWIAALLVAGLCLAMSDGPLFPLINLLGVALFALAGALLERSHDR